jgi:DNA-binding NarL/FixJ family response regulator
VQALRVVVAEDQALVREGVVRILERGGVAVLAAVDNAIDLKRTALAMQPDTIVTDIQMPPGNGDDGLRVALELRAALPGIGIVVLSQYLDADYVLDLVSEHTAGVGYLLKEKIGSPGVLLDAVRRVAAGGSALDPDVIAQLVGHGRGRGPVAQLTPREREVLTLMAEGHSNSGIAERLFVTVPAVERHVTGIFTKLDLQHANGTQHRRVLAVLTYLGGRHISRPSS